MIQRIVRLYGSEGVHTAFKKALLGELERYMYYQLFRDQIRAALEGAERVVFVPSDAIYAQAPAAYRLHLARLEGLGAAGGPPLRVYSFVKVLAAWGHWKRKLRANLFGLHAVLTAWVGCIGLRGKDRTVRRYDFAVTVMSAVPEVANGLRGVDYLLDNVHIRADNTLVVPLVRLSEEYRRIILELGMTIAEGVAPSTRWETGISALSLSELAKLTFNQAALATRGLLSAGWVTEAAAYLAKDCWTWHRFAKTYEVPDFITHIDFGLRHIGRNIVLNRHGTRTWYYLDSLNTGEASFTREDGKPYRSTVWSFLKYDTCVSWNQRHIEYFKLHKQDIDEYLAVGCMWSEHLRLFREGAIPSALRQKVVDAGYHPRLKVLAVFDTSYGQATLADFHDGTTFLQDMERLVIELPDIFLLFKEKKDRRYIGFDTATKVQGPSHGMEETIQRLEAQERFCFLGYDTNASEVLALCDLAISYPFTSTTLEALGAAGKGIYYDPTGKWAGASYGRIPNLVACGYEELRQRVEELLYHTSDQQHQQYLDQHVKGVLDPYVDGLALTRFRDLLCNGAMAEVAPGHNATVEAAIPGLGLQATEQGAAPVEPIS
jgi:polysaccharide biosynthesis PFTS motif protein